MARLIATLSCFVLCLGAAFAVTCSGSLSSPNPVTASVNVVGSCVLSVNVTGSVTVPAGASLSTTGSVAIDGSISATSANTINLQGTVLVRGGLQVTGAGSLVVGAGADVGFVLASDVGTLTLSGTATGVSVDGATNLNVFGTVTGGGVSRRGSGVTNVCGATVFGGISLAEVSGALNVGGTGCAPSEVVGAFLIEKGTGDVFISSTTTTAADVNVIEQTGDVTVANTQVSDLSVSSVTGSVTVTGTALDSDATIENVIGALLFNQISTMGDFGIVNPDPTSTVTLTNSDFGNEVVRISGADALVTVTGNSQFSFLATGNNQVIFNDNTAINVEFSGNTDVSLNRNTITNLVCSSNGAIGGSGNTVGFGDGQCSSGFP